MPPRRTSPRRPAIRPSDYYDRAPQPPYDEDVDDQSATSRLASAAPWLAVLALVLAGGALGYVILGRSSADPTACRTAAWTAVPNAKDLPTDWNLGSTDLNANGMTVSILGPTPADSSTNQPVVYASITCYGDAAEAALAQYRKAAEAAGSTVQNRASNGEAYDVDNPSTGSVTTLFRVNGLIGQIADGGTASDADLATITSAVAAAMGDKAAAGTASVPGASDAAAGSQEPLGSGDVGGEPSGSPFAPELVAVLPTSIADPASTTSPPAEITLSVDSASATDVFGTDPSSRAFAARIRSMGSTTDDLQVARAVDGSGTYDVVVDGFRIPGVDLARLKSAVIDTWLSGSGAGVKKTEITLSGKSVTKIDYGDGSAIEYVYAKADYVVVIESSDATIAAEVAAKLH